LTATEATPLAGGTPPTLVTVTVVDPPAGRLTLSSTVTGATGTYWPAAGAAPAGAAGSSRVAATASRARAPARARRRERVGAEPGTGPGSGLGEVGTAALASRVERLSQRCARAVRARLVASRP
jgi:hypothetical protein